MSEFEKNITFVIVCFRSSNVIEKCLESISSSCKVIIVENSNDIFIKNNLEKKFSNVQVLISGDNIGYGRANNLGISMVKSKLAPSHKVVSLPKFKTGLGCIVMV